VVALATNNAEVEPTDIVFVGDGFSLIKYESGVDDEMMLLQQGATVLILSMSSNNFKNLTQVASVGKLEQNETVVWEGWAMEL
jgi:hypothetical protein